MQTFAGTDSAAHASTIGQAETVAKTSKSMAKSTTKTATGNRASVKRNKDELEVGFAELSSGEMLSLEL